jgi:hypothetical protein
VLIANLPLYLTDPTRVFEHHGDYQCTGVPDGPQATYAGDSSNPGTPHRGVTSAGMDCLTESIPDGYGKLITFPLGLEGDINDVRPPNSTVLEWYYQLSARWVPKLECSEFPQPADDDDTTATPVAEAAPAGTAGAAAAGPASESSISHLPTDPAPAAASTQVATQPAKRRAKAKSTIPSAVYPRPRAMSFHNFAGPGDLNAKQSSFVFTYQVHSLSSVACAFSERRSKHFHPFICVVSAVSHGRGVHLLVHRSHAPLRDDAAAQAARAQHHLQGEYLLRRLARAAGPHHEEQADAGPALPRRAHEGGGL